MAGCSRVTHPSATKTLYSLNSRKPTSIFWHAAFYHSVNRVSPFDLHVLGAPPAFVLSQDQTLENLYFSAEALKSFSKLVSSLFSKKLNSNLVCTRPECYKGHLYISQCCLIFKVRLPFKVGFLSYHTQESLSTTNFLFSCALRFRRWDLSYHIRETLSTTTFLFCGCCSIRRKFFPRLSQTA